LKLYSVSEHKELIKIGSGMKKPPVTVAGQRLGLPSAMEVIEKDDLGIQALSVFKTFEDYTNQLDTENRGYKFRAT
jgi:hypothetical protein